MPAVSNMYLWISLFQIQTQNWINYVDKVEKKQKAQKTLFVTKKNWMHVIGY